MPESYADIPKELSEELLSQAGFVPVGQPAVDIVRSEHGETAEGIAEELPIVASSGRGRRETASVVGQPPIREAGTQVAPAEQGFVTAGPAGTGTGHESADSGPAGRGLGRALLAGIAAAPAEVMAGAGSTEEKPDVRALEGVAAAAADTEEQDGTITMDANCFSTVEALRKREELESRQPDWGANLKWLVGRLPGALLFPGAPGGEAEPVTKGDAPLTYKATTNVYGQPTTVTVKALGPTMARMMVRGLMDWQ